MPKWITHEQGTSGWLKSRLGHLTASRMADAMAFNKEGEPLEARKKYQYELLAERMTDTLVECYVTNAMQHGIEYEPVARSAYEDFTGNIVTKCGFALHDSIEFCGASPDGLLERERGLIEIKCPNTNTHIEWLLNDVVPEKHKPQMLLQLAVTKMKFVDFITFDPRLPSASQLRVWRYEPSKDDIEMVENHARVFCSELDLMWEMLFYGKK